MPKKQSIILNLLSCQEYITLFKGLGMSDKSMIDEFLKKNKVTQCEDGGPIDSSKAGRSRDHISAYDYLPDPMYDRDSVYDNKAKKTFTFDKKAVRKGAKKGRGIGMSWFYSMRGETIPNIRENTITERIASGRYTLITKKD